MDRQFNGLMEEKNGIRTVNDIERMDRPSNGLMEEKNGMRTGNYDK